MAKLKAELVHERHQREGASLRARLFARFYDLARLGSAAVPLSNLPAVLPGSGRVAERLFGIAGDRELPTFERETLRDWLADREPSVPAADAERRALLFPDTYTNFVHPETGKAAVRVLEAAGVHVQVARGVTGSGRPPHSKGFLDLARERAEQNVTALAPAVREGWDVVVVEPSDAVMLQSDYLDLLAGDEVEAVASNTYGVLEYLDGYALVPDADARDETVTYHGHCHQKATRRDVHAERVLREVGYEVDALDSTCCGMAGSFGYEAEHRSMSRAIGEILFDQVADSDGDHVAASGTSCRTQLSERTDEAVHPVELVAAAVE